MFDLITVGDATIDTFIKIHDAEVKCTLNHTDCKICVTYGSKIAVDQLTHLVAGNAANNAVGASRLKLKSAIYVNVGADSSGKMIADKLELEKVDLRYLIMNEGMESNYSAVLNFKGERTIFVYHQSWEYRLPDLDQSKWVYFTSISPSFVRSALLDDLTRYLERTGAKLLYNPGTYQIQAGVRKHPKLLALSEVFIVNKEESERILGIKGTEDVSIKRLLKGICDLGPRMTVITDGKEGSYGYNGTNYYQLKIFPAKLLEMTGAGDAFATGFLAGLFYGHGLPEAMRWGAANGASVVEFVGPQEGLLPYDGMQERLKENSEIAAKQI